MTLCAAGVQAGDEITWLDNGVPRTDMVEHIEEGTSHGCLYVCSEFSVWDWDVTHVNGEEVS